MLDADDTALVLEACAHRGTATVASWMSVWRTQPPAAGWPRELRRLAGLATGAGAPAPEATRLADNPWRAVALADAAYPARLWECLGAAAPPLLFARGPAALLDAPSIAIIGTRTPSAESVAATAAYAAELVARGFTVVSGNAPGIDAAAHGAAVAAGGATVVFPAAPPDAFSPAFDAEAAEDRMVVLSRFEPGATVRPWFFLARNELVAAHCRAAIIAETGARGGTLNTLMRLREYGRPVFALRLPEGNPNRDIPRLLAAGDVAMLPLRPDEPALGMLEESARRARRVATGLTEDLFAHGDAP